MISSNPKLPQFGPEDAQEFVARTFWARFQERFYTLWRELTSVVERMVAGPSGATDNAVVRFDGTSGRLVQDSDVFVTDDGRLYGTALHNNAGAVTGTTNQYVASGTYTPTYTANENCDSVGAFACQWLRVGNVVTVSGMVEVDATNAGSGVSFRGTLPIASALTAGSQLGGVGRSPGTNSFSSSFAIKGDATNDAAEFIGGVDAADAGKSISFSFTYLVL